MPGEWRQERAGTNLKSGGTPNVSADNDYGSGDGPNVWENNNLGQLNFSVVSSGAHMAHIIPFVTGNALDCSRYYEW